MKKTIIFLCSLLQIAVAQKQTSNWCFGTHAGINFNIVPPAVFSSAMVTDEGCSSISDATGKLLFYTNGVTVWDSLHNQMPNGFGLYGTETSTQSGLIVPDPGNINRYYIFTISDNTFPFWLCYSIVDMTLNGGLGDVTIKNTYLTSPVAEKLTAVKNSAGTGYWVASHGVNDSLFYLWEVTSSGVTASPVITAIGPVVIFDNFTNTYYDLGQMKFSTNGDKLAFCMQDTGVVELFDFDNGTGIVSGEISVLFPPNMVNYYYGLEFSPSGQFLYADKMTSPVEVYQWDISSNQAVTINNSRTVVGSSGSGMAALQLAPDGKIYIASQQTNFLNVINDPDQPGLLCNFADSALFLGTDTCNLGLPGFTQSLIFNNDETGMGNAILSGQDFIILQNPVRDLLHVTINDRFVPGLCEIKISDSAGKTVLQKNFSERIQAISLKHLMRGAYIVQIRNEEKFAAKKIILQ